MENIKICEICGFQTENGKIMSNHKRWKHIYPKDSEEYLIFLDKIIKKSSKRKEFTCICSTCKKEFKIELTENEFNKRTKFFCSRSCANSRGPRSEDFKRKVSEKLKKNKEKFFCKLCNKEINKNKTGFCRECLKIYNQNKIDKNSLSYYKSLCEFKFSLNEYPNEFDFKLIETYGWYSPSNSKNPNLNGVSRDHIISIMYGWENNIDPSIISHPANCRLIRQSENASKGKNCGMTLNQLLEKIKNWEEKYGDMADK
jgi:hypothetical protein